MRRLFLLVFCLVFWAGCSDEAGGVQDAGVEDRSRSCPSGDCTGSGDSGVDDAAGEGGQPVGNGRIQGTVHFRLYDGTTLPVAAPYVWWTPNHEPPEPFIDGLTCDCGAPPNSVRGGVDGRFSLNNVPSGEVYLVVQKGQFRRYRLIEVPANGTIVAPDEMTELPVRSDPENGDEIPEIAIGVGLYDAIEDVFAKLRMGPITSEYGFDYQEYMENPDAWGVELSVYQQPRETEDSDWELDGPDFLALLRDLDVMSRFDIIFAPCADVDRYATLLDELESRRNIEQFVYNGGKLYVTDYSYDVIEQPFPAYIDFRGPDGDGNADGHIGDPAYMGIATEETRPYDSENKALDPHLSSWLISVGATADGKLMTEDNWVNVRGVGTVAQCCDSDGNQVDVTPEIAMSGPNRIHSFEASPATHATWDAAEANRANFPHTLRFPVGCGEVMYSTYHTIDPRERQPDLHAQELVLLYLILEIGECNPEPIKEP